MGKVVDAVTPDETESWDASKQPQENAEEGGASSEKPTQHTPLLGDSVDRHAAGNMSLAAAQVSALSGPPATKMTGYTLPLVLGPKGDSHSKARHLPNAGS
jgi:hypothetical protein